MLLAIDAGNTQTVVGLYELDDDGVPDVERKPDELSCEQPLEIHPGS